MVCNISIFCYFRLTFWLLLPISSMHVIFSRRQQYISFHCISKIYALATLTRIFSWLKILESDKIWTAVMQASRKTCTVINSIWALIIHPYILLAAIIICEGDAYNSDIHTLISQVFNGSQSISQLFCPQLGIYYIYGTIINNLVLLSLCIIFHLWSF